MGLPRDVQMLTFVGPALELPQISDPTPEEVAESAQSEWHGEISTELKTSKNGQAAKAWRSDEVN